MKTLIDKVRRGIEALRVWVVKIRRGIEKAKYWILTILITILYGISGRMEFDESVGIYYAWDMYLCYTVMAILFVAGVAVVIFAIAAENEFFGSNDNDD